MRSITLWFKSVRDDTNFSPNWFLFIFFYRQAFLVGTEPRVQNYHTMDTENVVPAVSAPFSAKILATHTYHSISFYFIQVSCGNEKWHIWRRFNWIRSAYDALARNGTVTTTPFPSTGLFSGTDPESLKLRTESFQTMFDEWAAVLEKEFIRSFFSPVRQTLMIDEDMSVFSVISSLINEKLAFLDPLREGDCHTPSWNGHPVEALTHMELQIPGLVKILTEEEEETQVRLAINEIEAKKGYHQAGNPINPIRLEVFRLRLTELVTPLVQRHQSGAVADRVQKPGTNQETLEPEVVPTPQIVN